MLNFKSLIGLGLAASFVLGIGCTKPEKQDPADKDKEEQGADFRVDSGKANGWSDPVLPNDSWQKPMSTTFQFEACLTSRARDTKILYNEFVIEDPVSHQRLETVKTNPKGCLVWNEPIPFNYFVKRSRWVTLERDIVGLGVNRGKRRVTFAVNPWLAAHRKEISPAQSAYFLRDEPLELTRPEDRVKRVYEFFKDAILGANADRTLTAGDQSMLDAWRSALEAGSAQKQSLLALAPEARRALGGEDEGNGEIWVDEVKVISIKRRNISAGDSANPGENGFLIQQTVMMKPSLRIKQANGADVYEDIEQGDFDVYIQVVATDTGFDQNKKLILSESLKKVNAANLDALGGSPSGMGRVINGQLIAFINFKVNKRVAEGNVDFVVKLVPRRIGNRAPKPFEGIFNMGRVNSWIGDSKTGVIAQNCVPGLGNAAGCSYEGYLAQTSNFEVMKRNREASDTAPYQYSNIKARFVQVDQGDLGVDTEGRLKVFTGETATHRTVLYSASTCVTDSSGERVPPRQKFVIRYIGGDLEGVNTDPIEKLTDDNGCILWNNTLTHGFYKPEKFFQQVVSIEGAGGAKRIKTVYINPWDDKFTFGFDEEELGKEFFDKVAKRPRIASIFYLGDYSYHTVRFLYEIDPFMDLEVKKTVLMDIQPMVLRYSGIISGRKVTEHLRDGLYMMKVAIQKSYLDPADRMRKLCEVDRSRLVTDRDGNTEERWERATVADPQLCSLSREQRKISLQDQKKTLNGGSGPSSSFDKFQSTVVPKDFITTKTTLIRVTDGLVIQPVELAMKDLRLMRIRSNFLIELEAVDERKILFNDQLSKAYREMLSRSLSEHHANVEEFRRGTGAQPREEEIERDRAARDEVLVKAAKERREYYRDLYQRELQRLDQPGNIVADFNRSEGDLKHLLERFEKVTNPVEDLQDKDPKVQEEMRRLFERYAVYKKMAKNDFTRISLPDCEKINCDDFIEKDSGLEPRTFVGPVIFLSNSYKDAMRATDNLDEARCHEEIPGVDYMVNQADPVESILRQLESSLWSKSIEQTPFVRSNNAYRYNKYFSSLRQFCVRPVPGQEGQVRPKTEFYAKQVDDLIREEKSLKEDYQDKMKAMATPYNFASIYNLNFFSFGGEKLKRMDESKLANGCQATGIETCLTETTDHALNNEQMLERINRRLNERSSYAQNHWATWTPWSKLTDKKSFSLTDFQTAVFARAYDADSSVAVCGALASEISDGFMRETQGVSDGERIELENVVFRECFAKGKEGFFRDRKLRVYSTGDYAFMGGMQLNFNVTYGFGVSRSQSTSAGLDYLDVGKQAVGAVGLVGAAALAGTSVAGPVGTVAGAATGMALWAIKPLDLKRSSSMGSSSGTSVSEQTYLVGQIAKFSIPLKEWEQCSVIRLHPSAVQSIAGMFDKRFRYGVGREKSLFERVVAADHRTEITDPVKDRINTIFGRGFFVCDGIRRTKDVGIDGREKLGKDIEELYFYFTQHFTEGDMLDQADLYNNPWLLSLRGKRDFAAFVQLIRGQEVVSLSNFVDGLIGSRPKPTENPAWALEHMANIYKAILPSFPGLYTELEEGEGMDFFMLKSRNFLSRDLDINAEVKRAGDSGRGTGRTGATPQ